MVEKAADQPVGERCVAHDCVTPRRHTFAFGQQLGCHADASERAAQVVRHTGQQQRALALLAVE